MEKVVIQLDADVSMAIKDIEKVDESIQGLNDELVTTEKGFKGLQGGAKLAQKGIRGIGNALKGAGIGLAVAAFTLLKDIFKENQVVTDAFKTAFEFLSIAFNDFANFIFSSGGKITGFFKAIFDDPLSSITKLGIAIKNNIIDRFNSLLDTLGFAGTALKKLFEGDFAGAVESAKQATTSLIDTIAIVDTETLAKGFNAVTNGVKSYVTETTKAAVANVELEKTARLAEAANQGLIEKYDRQAEQLRQIRDDESKSFEERIKANQELGALLDEQEKAMMANANTRVRQAEAELSKNKENIENQIAYQEALNELAGIEAQITGFRSEQQTNTNSLLREQTDLQNELALIGKSEREIERLELQQDYEAKKLLIEREVTDEAEKNERLLALQEDYNGKLKILEDAKFEMASATLGNISKAVGENTKAGKMAAAAAALINTYQGITAELSTKTVTPFEFGIKLANIATTAAIGFKSVKDILKTNPKTASGGSKPSASAPSSTPPAFNIVGASAENQLAESIAGQKQQPIKAFVTSQDVTTAQSLERNIVEGASI
jgi:hypothetical protein